MDEYASLSDDQLKAKTDEFKQRIADATAALQAEIEGLKDEKRRSEDGLERERLSLQVGGLEADLLEVIEDTLEDILPEAFAVVKDACRRLMGREILVTGQKLVWDMVPYDVQLMGGIALHDGKACEMATGEGQDTCRDHAALSERTHGSWCALGHGKHLLGSARRRVDGHGLQLPRAYL